MSVCWCSVCVLSFVNYLKQNKPKTSIPKDYFQGIFKNMFANTKQMTWIIMDPSPKKNETKINPVSKGSSVA